MTLQPTTELESAVDKLLKSAKLRENEIAQTESLKMNELSVEEVAARRAELAKMRDLMFRAEAKAKRIAKIKSKTYRRIKKKERARLAEKLGELVRAGVNIGESFLDACSTLTQLVPSVRMNFSHGSYEYHQSVIDNTRKMVAR